MRPVRIANVIEEGKLGGPQVRMVRVAVALSRVGTAETRIIMPRVNSKTFREMCDAHKVPYHVLALTRITKELPAALAYILFSPFEVLGLVQLFRRERIDIVHASGGSWQYKAVIAARLAGIPSVWHLNDSYAPDWVRWLFRLVAPLASGFIFASHRSQEYYGELIQAGRPQAVVPSTVDLETFNPALDIGIDKDVPTDVPVIGTIANVNPIKSLETLIRATARLQSMAEPPHLVIAGPIFASQRKYFRRLEAIANMVGGGRVHFIGARSDVRPILRQLDVYICSSEAESSPVSVWEAMAMALPVVSTDVGDVARYLHDGETGFIVRVGDESAIADRVAQLLSDPSLRSHMGEAAREAAQEFRPKKIALLTLGLYRLVIAKHK